MRVLVTWGSKLGGTEGIAEVIVETLRAAGHEIVARDIRDAPSPKGFDAAIIGAAVYANRWVASARRYIEHHVRELRRIPTWLFSSGPLDASATGGTLDAPHEVRGLVLRIGALGHETFGGRLEPDAKGIIAHAMAKHRAGDWRDFDRVRAWASGIALQLPEARPRPATVLHGRAFSRVLEYGATGWAILAVLMLALLALTSQPFAVFAHLLLAPIVFGLLARRYQNADGARAPFATAVVWTVMVGLLDGLLLSGVVKQSIVLISSVAAFWMPLLLIFTASWAVGTVSAMFPITRGQAAVQ
jgi:menaquinone-dependent protoporphyrinogen oxidase